MKHVRNQKPTSITKRSICLTPLEKKKTVGLRYTKALPKEDIIDIQDLEKSLQLIREAYYSDDVKLVRIRKKTISDMVCQSGLRFFREVSGKRESVKYK